MLSSLRLPRRRRISIGPQSEADAREYLANREQMRKDGRSTSTGKLKKSRRSRERHGNEGEPSPSVTEAGQFVADNAVSSGIETQKLEARSSLNVSAPTSRLLTPPASDAGASSDSGREDDRKDREMFSGLEKPRTRYDVEVITKLVVYAGKYKR